VLQFSLDLWQPDWLQCRPIFGALVILIVLDFLIGFVIAWLAKEVSSTVSFKGMAKKAAMILFVMAAVVLDPFVTDFAVAKLIATFFLFTEMISITENLARIGVPVPEWLLTVLAKLKLSSAQVASVQGTPKEKA